MKLINVLIGTLLLSIQSYSQPKTSSNFHSFAPTPPLGWNSWDCFGPTVVESEVKANADYMAKYLKSSGWEYVVVDIRWYVGNDKAHGYNETDPDYVVDEYGRFLPAVNRFPSASGGKGFKPLADYIHGKGLKFGIHIMRGIPIIAVKKNLPIKGSSATANQVYSEALQCRWLRDMYTIVRAKDGAQEYYNSIFELYASWGVDFVKVDDLSIPYHTDEVEMIRKAIDRTGRKIVLSTSPGETPIQNANHVQQHANMWRTVGDFWDNWPQLKEHFAVFERWNPYRISGGWPDGDMLPLGHIGIRAERGDPRMTAFTKDEQYTLMTLWAIFRSPLMFGGHLPDNDAFTLSLLTNKRVLDVLKYSTNNKPLFNHNELIAWTADDPKTGDKYLAVFNAIDAKDFVEEKALWSSGPISRQTPGQSKEIDVDISGAKKLYLAVSNSGDNIEWDHADWIAPMLYRGKDTMSLTRIKWKKAKAGWGNARVNKAVSGSDLIVNGQTYTNGIGTHAASLIEYDLPAGITRFKALVGLDKAGVVQDVGSTVTFMVFTENPAGPPTPESAIISVNLNELGFDSACTIQDLWTGKTVGVFAGEFAPSIRRHGTGFYRLSKGARK
jgi:hypothetical protein